MIGGKRAENRAEVPDSERNNGSTATEPFSAAASSLNDHVLRRMVHAVSSDIVIERSELFFAVEKIVAACNLSCDDFYGLYSSRFNSKQI